MLEIKNITKTFNKGTVNEKKALRGVNLTLNDGDFVTVIGGNGAGKSTLLNAIAGVWPVDSGAIVIDGKDVTRLPEYKRAAFLGRVFQDPMNGTAATMGIEENLALALRRGRMRNLKPGIKNEERKLYVDMLKRLGLGLEDRLTSKVGLLSGGQRQALTLLMSTLQRPKLLLLDEHTAALDPKTAKKVLDLTAEMVEEQKVAEITGISNPMNYKILQSFESGKYTTQDQVFYSKDIIDIKGTHTYMIDRLGNKVKYMIDDVKCWDDADLVKYILKRCLDGQ